MTQIAIQTQLDAIKKVTEEVLKSKEATLQFLIDAGIINEKRRSSREHYTTTAPTRSESAPRKKNN